MSMGKKRWRGDRKGKMEMISFGRARESEVRRKRRCEEKGVFG